MYRKNTASQFIHFQGVDATTGGIKSGVTWTIRRCIDGTFAAGGGTVTEDGTTGWYKYAMAQADTNGNNLGFNFTGTGAVPQTVNAITTACDPTTATNFGITALPAVASGSAGAVLIDGTGTAAISNSSGKVLLQAAQKVDVDTIKTNPVVNGGTITFPTNATLASTTNITAATGITAATVSDKTGYALTAAYDPAKTAAQAGDAMALTGGERTTLTGVILTTAVTESYRAKGAAPTLAQAVCEMLAHMGEVAIASTTKTINGFDGVTAKETFTLDSATTPAAITRAT